MNRYYVTRKPSKPGGGVWKVFDRKLDMIYASCEFREQANNIKDCLNSEQDRQELQAIDDERENGE